MFLFLWLSCLFEEKWIDQLKLIATVFFLLKSIMLAGTFNIKMKHFVFLFAVAGELRRRFKLYQTWIQLKHHVKRIHWSATPSIFDYLLIAINKIFSCNFSILRPTIIYTRNHAIPYIFCSFIIVTVKQTKSIKILNTKSFEIKRSLFIWSIFFIIKLISKRPTNRRQKWTDLKRNQHWQHLPLELKLGQKSL